MPERYIVQTAYSVIQCLEKTHHRAVPADSTNANCRKKMILSAKPKTAISTSEQTKAISTADAMKYGNSDNGDSFVEI